jgi:hypothetical protein
VGFEHTIPVFERAKRVHALDREATVNGHYLVHLIEIKNVVAVVGKLRVQTTAPTDQQS